MASDPIPRDIDSILTMNNYFRLNNYNKLNYCVHRPILSY